MVTFIICELAWAIRPWRFYMNDRRYDIGAVGLLRNSPDLMRPLSVNNNGEILSLDNFVTSRKSCGLLFLDIIVLVRPFQRAVR